jgi:hypothetical protein
MKKVAIWLARLRLIVPGWYRSNVLVVRGKGGPSTTCRCMVICLKDWPVVAAVGT